MSPSEQFVALREQSLKSLAEFLRIELDLADTLLQMAHASQDAGHRERLLESVQTAIVTVRHFAGRLTDEEARNGALERADRLEAAIAPKAA